MEIEAVLLAGGASRRMGRDKARLEVGGQPLAERIAGELANAGCRVTVLGGNPIAGYGFTPDQFAGSGPLEALRHYKPAGPFVFVAACDLAAFDAAVLSILSSLIGDAEAAVPIIGGHPQPLCALYRAAAFEKLTRVEGDRLMGWLDALDVRGVSEDELGDAKRVRGANTPEELEELL